MSSSTVFPRVTTNAVTIEATAASASVARTGVRRSGFCLSTNLPSSELMTSHQRTPAPIATFPPVGTARDREEGAAGDHDERADHGQDLQPERCPVLHQPQCG